VIELPSTAERGRAVVTIETTWSASTGIVSGVQTFEIRSHGDETERELELPLRYALIDRDEFRCLVAAQGFVVEDVFGDYERGPFEPMTSATSVWVLRRSSDE